MKKMKQGLETIHSTGKGLINFVMSYRKTDTTAIT